MTSRSKGWTSMTDIRSSEGATHVPMDLWGKNKIVRSLEEQSASFMESQTKKFGALSPEIRDMFERAIRDYTSDTGFNKVMMLLRFMDLQDVEKNTMWYELKNARKEWNRTNPMLLARCRIMAHLCANCSYDQDITVYRGFKDKRSFSMNDKKGALKGLKAIQILNNIEAELKTLFKTGEETDMGPILADVWDPSNLIDQDDASRVYELIESLSRINAETNLDSRDVSELVHSVGNVVETETFMSTSLSIEQARRFKGEECCLVQITVPAGTPCLYISPYSEFTGNDSELEIVLPPCSRLIVLGTSQGITRVRCDGITSTTKKRMTLDAPRIYLLQQMLFAIIRGNRAKHVLKNGIGLSKLCKKFEGFREHAPLHYLLTTFSNDTVRSDWDEKEDPERWYWRTEETS
jgi:hypothetical protein